MDRRLSGADPDQVHGWRESWSPLRWLGIGECVHRRWQKAWALFSCCFIHSSSKQSLCSGGIFGGGGINLIPSKIFKGFLLCRLQYYIETCSREVTYITGRLAEEAYTGLTLQAGMRTL